MKMTLVDYYTTVKMIRLNTSNLVSTSRLIAAVAIIIASMALPDRQVENLSLLLSSLFLLLLASDGVDGWLARRYNHESQFGAKLDEMADVVFNLSLCLIVYLLTPVGFWVFGIIGVKIVYEGAKNICHPLQNPIPAYFPIGKAVHVVSSILLIICLWPFGGMIQTMLSFLAVVMVILSFTVYTTWQIIRYKG
jgi:phosphatidylglycerophosphate synthase